MKKALCLALVVVALVASLGFVTVASASVANADEAKVNGTGVLTAQGDGIAISGGKL